MRLLIEFKDDTAIELTPLADAHNPSGDRGLIVELDESATQAWTLLQNQRPAVTNVVTAVIKAVATACLRRGAQPSAIVIISPKVIDGPNTILDG